MIWASWRQFRVPAGIAAAALVVVAIALTITGTHLAHLYDTTVATCHATSDCSAAKSALLGTYGPLQNAASALLIATPAAIGIFWGAPLLAREFEMGTWRLAWTQGSSRSRWLGVRFAMIGFASVAVAGLLSLLVTWWFSPIDEVNMNRLVPAVFDARGIVAIGYAAFAFAVGVTAGLLIRRTLPAMAATLGAFIGARVAVASWLRPHFMAPVKSVIALHDVFGAGIQQTPTGLSYVQPADVPNAWIFANEVVNNAGQAPKVQFLQRACPSMFSDPGASPANSGVGGTGTATAGPTRNPNVNFSQCAARVGAKFHELVTYQPGSRYWAFQWYETAIFVGAAIVLVALSFWWIRRRLS